ncbi:MAG: sigma-70 family RNA polymerase sigma factor [bacterium]|nr:sigma-70 family RNA polymerase sigma factor [bacterium]
MIDWNEILARYGPAVWLAAYRVVGRADDAEECLQEAFMGAFTLSQRERIRSWPAILKSLAVNRALDRLRRRARQGDRQATEPSPDHVPSIDPGPEQLARAGELAERLRAAVLELPSDQARVFCLCCLADLSRSEAARVLGIKTNAVRVILHRARSSLRQRLALAPTDKASQ